MNKWIKILATAVVSLLLIIVVYRNIQEREGISGENIINKSNVFIENLEVPWEIVLLPDNRILVTERRGRVLLIDQDTLEPKPFEIDEVEENGEGGLLGMALHPNFDSNHFVYLYYTYRNESSNLKNKVVRYILKENILNFESEIISEIPGNNFHNGGRIKFGPDGFLFITTGDAETPSLSQNTSSLAGKILRITDEGEIPSGNPFGNEIFSYGHRNPQGIAFDDSGNLWATEHGPSAGDEINRIQMGGNYGWPLITGIQEREGMISPIVQSGSDTWAPSGLVISNGSLFFAGLRGQSLFRLNIDNEDREVTHYFSSEFGRLRTIILGPDGYFYITTNNKDGRGIPGPGDDKIIKLDPNFLQTQ